MNVLLVIWCIFLAIQGASAGAGKHYFAVTCEVLDKSGMPVPNAAVRVVAVDDDATPYPDSFSTGVRTDSNGVGSCRFGDQVTPKPGRLLIEARHPSIGRVTKTIEWSAVLYETQATASVAQPAVVLRANGGPGLDAWRQSAAAKAPALVQALLEAKDDSEVKSLTEEIAAGEMLSVPALVKALDDYQNPRRTRLVGALLQTWNASGGTGSLDEATRQDALVVCRVNSAVRILGVKPRANLSFVQDKNPAVLREVAWLVETLQTVADESEQKGDIESARATQFVLSRIKEAEQLMRDSSSNRE